MKALRRSKEWLLIQKTLPKTFPSSEFNPIYSSLSDTDKLEAWLLSLSEEDYDKIQPKTIVSKDKPALTGDAIADQWEREFWETQKGE